MKRGSKALLFVGVGLLAFVAVFFFLSSYQSGSSQEKIVTGKILDCDTNEPVSGVSLIAMNRGIGFENGSLLLDQTYDYIEKENDSDGSFQVPFFHGDSIILYLSKDGYYSVQKEVGASEQIEISMLEGDRRQSSYDCRPPEECIEEYVENGVEVFRNVCTSSG